MAIIELNLEKPALKRVESGEKPESRSVTDVGSEPSSEEPKIEANVTTTETGSSAETSYEPSMEDQRSEGSESGGKSRLRKYGRRMVVLGGTAAGVAAARKLRQRRKSSGQQELDEDWQTADATTSTGTESDTSVGSSESSDF